MEPGCNSSPGTFGMFTINGNYEIQQPLAQFFVAQLINLEWAKTDGGEHEVYAAHSDVDDGAGHELVTAYAVKRPDGQWAVMLVNRDQQAAHKVRIEFHGAAGGNFSGAVEVATFGSAQYQWHPARTQFEAHAEHAAEKTVQVYTKGWARSRRADRANQGECWERYGVRPAAGVGDGDSWSNELPIAVRAQLGSRITSATKRRHRRSPACGGFSSARRRPAWLLGSCSASRGSATSRRSDNGSRASIA